MKLVSKLTIASSLALLLSSFSTLPGGEGFEVYLNNNLIVQQFGSDVKQVKAIQLSKESANDRLTIKYYHCGKTGTDRTVIIKDEKDNIVKSFRYPNTSRISAMEVPLKDLLAGRTSRSLKLYYSSHELPKGRNILAINTTASAAVVQP